ncbi:hydroxyacid dehydrogenase [Paenibacillus cremeus]|uniref:Hydroxyacid dehydrogenase n=1 Tax=Paenibacillus cremeus TaxID=2163881 RepID=A0A559K527_9BACL|nr:hydroxyacid dehydrogenase [Paenibacillus cremeus]TVY07234.1 hydroxyacid dehydrogenase [Paenibacillus cremeus]
MSQPKIVMLQGVHQINRVFAEKHLKQLRALGELVMNEQAVNPTPERVQELIQGADVVITSWGCPRLDASALDLAPNLKLVVHAAGTVKGIVSPELWERDIQITSGACVIGQGVAETALGMTIASLKDMWRLSVVTKQGEWNKQNSKARELYDITVGVIGAGHAGTHYIKLMQNFKVDVLLYDPYVSEEKARAMGARKASLEELLTQADVVSIHAPGIPATDKMINRDTLALMKDDAILINTSRGTVIDEEALAEELAKGRLFACLDTTNPEPPRADHPFRRLPNLVMTPHIAGGVTNGLYALAQFVVDETKAFLEGQSLSGQVEQAQMSIIA